MHASLLDLNKGMTSWTNSWMLLNVPNTQWLSRNVSKNNHGEVQKNMAKNARNAPSPAKCPPPPPPSPNIWFPSLRTETPYMCVLMPFPQLEGRGGEGRVAFHERVWSLVSPLVEKQRVSMANFSGLIPSNLKNRNASLPRSPSILSVLHTRLLYTIHILEVSCH